MGIPVNLYDLSATQRQLRAPDQMTHGGQCGQNVISNATFGFEASIDAKAARRVEGFLYVHSVVDDVLKNLDLTYRLIRAAHNAEG